MSHLLSLYAIRWFPPTLFIAGVDLLIMTAVIHADNLSIKEGCLRKKTSRKESGVAL